MTEMNFNDDWMAQEWPRIKRGIPSSGKKLVPVSSAEILENYRKELEAIEKNLSNGKICGRVKMQRVLSQRDLLINELIPRAEERLGIRKVEPSLS